MRRSRILAPPLGASGADRPADAGGTTASGVSAERRARSFPSASEANPVEVRRFPESAVPAAAARGDGGPD